MGVDYDNKFLMEQDLLLQQDLLERLNALRVDGKSEDEVMEEGMEIWLDNLIDTWSSPNARKIKGLVPVRYEDFVETDRFQALVERLPIIKRAYIVEMMGLKLMMVYLVDDDFR